MEEIYKIAIAKDEEVQGKINNFMLEKKWNAALILCGIGSVRDVQYSALKATGDSYITEVIDCPAPAEIVSFTGEIRKTEGMDPAFLKVYGELGEYFIHIHAAVAINGGVVYGGGFRKGYALRGVNVYIRQMPDI